MTTDLMAFVDEEAEAASGGGFYITEIELGVGWLVLAKGARKDRYFKVTDAIDRIDQKTAAEAVAATSGLTQTGNPKVPYFCTTVYMYAESVLNRSPIPTWKDGVWEHDLLVWWPSYTKTLGPSLIEAFGGKENIAWYTRIWAEVKMVPDPNNEKSGRDDKVPMIVQIFADEEAARAAVVEGGGTPALKGPEKPDGWDDSGPLGLWHEYAQSVLNEIANNGDTSYFVSPQFGFGELELANLVAYHVDNDLGLPV